MSLPDYRRPNYLWISGFFPAKGRWLWFNFDRRFENMQNSEADREVIATLKSGSEEAFADFFFSHQERLLRIVKFRLDFRLGGRISASDVLQESYVRAAARLAGYLENPDFPPFVWLRMQVNQQITDLHRKHLGAEKRDARREYNLNGNAQAGPMDPTSMALAAHLVAQQTSPSRVVQRYEEIAALEASLNTINAVDREVIALRHFEELSSQETAQVLGIEPAAASKRYVRALQRLKEIMNQHGFARE
jgi:RNA polymerase sigma-70 factor (subfamily 1)